MLSRYLNLFIINQLFNKYNYEYTKEDVKIFKAANDEVNLCKSKAKIENKEKKKFEL